MTCQRCRSVRAGVCVLLRLRLVLWRLCSDSMGALGCERKRADDRVLRQLDFEGVVLVAFRTVQKDV